MSLKKQTVTSSIVAIVCIAVMLIVVVTSLSRFTESVQHRAASYLRDISGQSARIVDEHFAGLVGELDIAGRNLASLAGEDRQAMLDTDLGNGVFSGLAYIEKDGTIAAAQSLPADLFSEDGWTHLYADAVLQGGGAPAARLQDEYLVLLVPLPSDGGSGAMLATQRKDTLDALLGDEAVSGIGSTFLMGTSGEILAGPVGTDGSDLLTALADGAADATDSTVDLADGSTFFVDRRPLAFFGWSVLTVEDAGFLTEGGSYATQIIVTVLVLTAVLTVLMILIAVMRRRYQRRLEAVAFVDELTGGMSFFRFKMLAGELIAKGEPDAYALVTLNVKRFKLINQLGGSMEGDDLLRRIYAIIRDSLHESDEMVAHSTADNFAILLRNDGERNLENRLTSIAARIEMLDTVLPVHVSQGVYVTADPNVDIIMFLDRSNSARVSEPHEYSSTTVFYNDQFVQLQEERLRMIGMIEEGLKNDEFTVYLQPKVSPQAERIMGAEALVRWIHPTRGMIRPDSFIPLCEQTGLICALDLHVFRKVCRQIQQWHERGWEPDAISVNVSGRHLKNLDFIQQYRAIADEYDVDPSLIELELTESIMFSDLDTTEARSVIDAIHEYGFWCSMDDFGSGYSALGVLNDLPIDCIKLDRSFFAGRTESKRARTVIAAIITLARELGMVTVAEGIEDKEQVRMLKELNCDLIQGFYYSPPLPMAEFAEMAFVRQDVHYKKD